MKDTLAEWLSWIAGEDIRVSRIDSLAHAIGRTPSISRPRILSRIEDALDNSSELSEEASRIAVAKALAALLPDSEPLIRQVLNASPNEPTRELQFSLFVFLSDIDELGLNYEDAGLRNVVEQYLLQVAADPSQAAWMAGDMLGDHWDVAKSLPILCRVARSAEHEAGRNAALHGLAHALHRASQPQRWRILEVLQEVSANDASASVRSYAADIISGADDP